MSRIADYCFSTGQVEMPKIVYNGQKLIKLVKINTPDNTSRIIPSVPLITFVKKRVMITAEMTNLINLSAEDIFFFILNVFNGL